MLRSVVGVKVPEALAVREEVGEALPDGESDVDPERRCPRGMIRAALGKLGNGGTRHPHNLITSKVNKLTKLKWVLSFSLENSISFNK